MIEDILRELKNEFRIESQLQYYFVFDRLYCDFIMVNFRYSNIPILCSGNVDTCCAEEIIKKTKKLFDKFVWAENSFGKISIPKNEDQKHEGGYFRKMISEDIEVEFERICYPRIRHFGNFAITGISKKDNYGFYYLDEPKTIEEFSKDFSPIIKGVDSMRITVSRFDYALEEGEEIYMWDNITYLSGTAGLVIVKNGNVIKTKMTMIS
jgi:hypothetical protein